MRCRIFSFFVTLIFVFYLALAVEGKDTEALSLQAVGYRVITHDWNYSYTTPGRSNTSCYGSASTLGNGTINGNAVDWNAVTNLSADCQTVSTPPQTYSGTIRHFEIFNALRGQNGLTYIVTCSTHWIGSKCSWLRPGDHFQAEANGNTLWISARKGGNRGKPVRVKYRILDAR